METWHNRINNNRSDTPTTKGTKETFALLFFARAKPVQNKHAILVDTLIKTFHPLREVNLTIRRLLSRRKGNESYHFDVQRVVRGLKEQASDDFHKNVYTPVRN